MVSSKQQNKNNRYSNHIKPSDEFVWNRVIEVCHCDERIKSFFRPVFETLQVGITISRLQLNHEGILFISPDFQGNLTLHNATEI